MAVLVTRPEADGAPLIEILKDAEHRVFSAPMMAITPTEDGAQQLKACSADAQALLVTSANGVRAFAALSNDRTLPVMAVGDATAGQARAAGFAGIYSAGGDVDDLVRLVTDRLNPDDGPLLHIAGTRVAGDLAGKLQSAGFDIRRAVLYRAEAATTLPDPVVSALQAGEIDFALFFSPRSAAIFSGLICEVGLQKTCEGVTALCLSQAVADQLSDSLVWQHMRVAEFPTQASLLALLDKDAT